MTDQSYYNLAKVLNTLPNGFPPTESGVEIKLLKKVFDPDEAELFCDLRLTFETAEQISKRTGRSLDGLDVMLQRMGKKGQVFAIDFGGTSVYKMLPWAFGIYEFQLERIDREFCELIEEYSDAFGREFFKNQPQFMRVLPIQEQIEGKHQALPYEQVSFIVENSKSFRIMDCICKKEKKIMGKPCDRPLQVCMSFAPIPGFFEKGEWPGNVISKQEAYDILAKAEEDALVHLTWNEQSEMFFICNCCGCCCGVLQSINKLGIPAQDVINSAYYAVIDPDKCAFCGTCADERCQVNAIEPGDDTYEVIHKKCIGCGLCISTCPEEAITLVRKDEKDYVIPPENENKWFAERGRIRGMDFSKYK
jgi:electron transport complex protein RnfB